MKRLLVVIIMALLVMGSFGPKAIADEDSVTAMASATVTSLFSIALDLASLDFGPLAPGEYIELNTAGLYGDYHNEAICKTNSGLPWYLKISATELASGPDVMPVGVAPDTKYGWMSTYAGSKNAPYDAAEGVLNHPPAGGYVPFDPADELVFSSVGSDNNTMPEGMGVQLSYILVVPATQIAGAYSSTVTYTMTETL